MRPLLALLAGATAILLVLGSGGPAQAGSEAECQVRHAVCVEGCQTRSCRRICDEHRRRCLQQAHDSGLLSARPNRPSGAVRSITCALLPGEVLDYPRGRFLPWG